MQAAKAKYSREPDKKLNANCATWTIDIATSGLKTNKASIVL